MRVINTITGRFAFCAAALAVLASGCGPKASNTSASGGTSTASTSSADANAPITIGYSDWPGWTAWDIVEQQGFFKKHNVNVKLVWFPNYSDSLNALSAGQVDANCQTWSDTMGPLAQGQALKAVLINDNSAGNDAIVAQPGINSVKDLKGKNVATELGTCDQFLLDEALAANGMSEKDIHYVNIKVQDCPAAMIAHKIDACAVWEPNKSQLLQKLPGTKDIFDSKQVPGMIPDLLVFQKKVVDARPQDIQNIVDAWYDMLSWWKTHPDDAVKIEAKRTDSPVDFYKSFITGTRIFSGPEAVGAFTQSAKPTSLYASGDPIAKFLVGQQQIPKVPDYTAALDGTFVKKSVESGLGKEPPYAYTLKVD
jgi:NitT/TauT family transport system substrate-binding protein